MDILKQVLTKVFGYGLLPAVPSVEILIATYKDMKYEPFVFVSPKIKVGIEVEVENIREGLALDPRLWNNKEDGSLRNHGREFVSTPLKGEEISFAIQQLYTYLPKKADFSDRTSIHVHVNTRDFSYDNLLCLMLYYIVFEKLLYRFAGPKRFKNIFCVPVQETKLPIALSNFLVNGNILNLIGEWAKYSGLNLLPLKSFGTVEYRHMIGHRDPMLLQNWINILMRIHVAAKEADFESLYNRIKKLNTNSMYEDFLNDVFAEDAKLLRYGDLQKEMEYGVSVVKSITPPSPFLKDLLANISNDSYLLKSLNIGEADTKKAGELVQVPLERAAPDAAEMLPAEREAVVRRYINDMAYMWAQRNPGDNA